MKILVLTSSFPRYKGDYFGPWILEYCLELRNQGCEVFVIAPNSGDIPIYHLSEKKIHIKRFNYFIPKRLQKLVSPPGIIPNLKSKKLLYLQIPSLVLNYLMTAYKIAKKYEIDIIHSQWAIPSGYIGGIISKHFKIPHVITTQGGELFLPLTHPFTYFTKMAINNCKYLLPVSEQMGKKAEKMGVDKEKIIIIPNSVNTNKFKPMNSNFRRFFNIPQDTTLILTIRRLVFEKRVNDVILAFNKSQENNSHLIIIGDGPDRKQLEELVVNLNLEERVHFLGFVRNKHLPHIYADADIYILSSQQEGLSLSLLEGLATELIVISTSSTGGSDVIENGKNGFLYPVGDVEKLTNLLDKVSNLDQETINSIKRKSRETVIEKFSVPVMVNQYIEIYDKIKE